MLDRVPKPIRDHISAALGCKLKAFDFVSGGCINPGGQLTTDRQPYFLKWNDAKKFPDMFVSENAGLKILSNAAAIRVPNAILNEVVGDFQFLLMEYVEQGKPARDFWRNFGEQLAQLHKISSPYFVLPFNNYIGSLPQRNTKHIDWLSFFIHERLMPQVATCRRDNKLPELTLKAFDKLYSKLPALLSLEEPALLHGDLWRGNFLCDTSGNPCLIDPAVYYGHRETEIAFTKLFGGFEKQFYDSYNAVFPLEKEFETRVDLYNLYPLLVHVNLFGRPYANEVVSIVNHYV